MKKIIIGSIILTALLSTSQVVLANETETGVEATTNVNTSNTPKRPVPGGLNTPEMKAMLQNKTNANLKIKLSSTSEPKKERPASTSTPIKERMENIKDRLASTGPLMRDKIASTSEKRRENAREFLKKQFEKMLKRIEATIQRQETITAKINSRIEKIKTAGGNTTEAEKLTLEAKLKIDTAKTLFVTLKTSTEAGVQDISTTTESVKKETMEKMRKTTQEIEKNLRAAHLLLEKALGSLKGLSQLRTENSVKATSTVNTSTTTGTN